MKELMNSEAAAAYLGGHAVQTLAKWRVYGKGPLWCKIGRSVFYDRRQLDEYIDERMRCSTSDPGRISDAPSAGART
jgi:hypothetical protein